MIESQYRRGPRINNAEIAHILAGTGDVGYIRRANLETAGGVDAPAHLAPLPAAYTAPRGTSMDRPFPSSPCPAHQLRLLTRTLTGRCGSGAPAVDASQGDPLHRAPSTAKIAPRGQEHARGAGSLGEDCRSLWGQALLVVFATGVVHCVCTCARCGRAWRRTIDGTCVTGAPLDYVTTESCVCGGLLIADDVDHGT